MGAQEKPHESGHGLLDFLFESGVEGVERQKTEKLPVTKKTETKGFTPTMSRRSNKNTTRIIEPLVLAQEVHTWPFELTELQVADEITTQAEETPETVPVSDEEVTDEITHKHATDKTAQSWPEGSEQEQSIKRNMANLGEFVNPGDINGQEILIKIRAHFDNEIALLDASPDPLDKLQKKEIEKKRKLFEKIMGNAKGVSLFVYGKFNRTLRTESLQEAATVRGIPNLTPHCIFNTFPEKNGGSGAVWYGWDLVLDRPIAIKALRLEFADKSHQLLFEREGRALASHENPRVVNIYEMIYHQKEGNPYLIMEYLDSDIWQTVNKFLVNKKNEKSELSLQELSGFVSELYEAYDWLKSKGLEHGDWKAANVFIFVDEKTKKVHLKVGDFGSSSKVELDRNRVMGTIKYNPPDYIVAAETEGNYQKYTVDELFSLGVMILEMTGEQGYYKGKTEEEISTEAHYIITHDDPHRIDDPAQYPVLHEWAEEHITDTSKRALFFDTLGIALAGKRFTRFSSHKTFFSLLKIALS